MAKYPPLEVPSWGIGALFAGFLVITLIWEKATHAIEHWLHEHNKPGLKKVVHALKEEILVVGVIVLILPLFESHLQTICIPKKWSYSAPGYNTQGWFLGEKTVDTKPYPDACDKNKCYDRLGKPVDGYVKLYPYEAIHGVHIFIALTAIVHIIFACISMLLCLWRVQCWQKWESKALESPIIVMNPTVIRSLGKSPVSHALKSVINQFLLHVTQPLYSGIRRLFLEQLKAEGGLDGLPVDFPFLSYVKEAMELSFGSVVGVTPMVWMFAILQLIVPFTFRVWCVVLICACTVVLMIITGAKLHSVVVHLAARSHYLYSEETLAEHAAALTVQRTPSELLSANFDRKHAVDQDKDVGVGPPKKLKRGEKAQANLVKKYKGYSFRAHTDTDLPNMFWFKRPGLLLWFYKLAYFQSAFCCTLVLFAFWKDNQFLPSMKEKTQLMAFCIALTINVLLSFYQSTCVLPVYALVSITDKKAFDRAGEFLQRDIKYKALHSSAETADSFRQTMRRQEHQNVVDVLQQLASHVNRMELVAAEAGGKHVPGVHPLT